MLKKDHLGYERDLRWKREADLAIKSNTFLCGVVDISSIRVADGRHPRASNSDDHDYSEGRGESRTTEVEP